MTNLEKKFGHIKDGLSPALRGFRIGSSPSFSSALSKIEYFKLIAAAFSIVLLHVIFFSLNVDFLLWPLIDLSFLANVTFSFSFVVALALFSIRLVPFSTALIFLLALNVYYGAITGIRSRKSKSRFAQKSPYTIAATRLFSKHGKIGKMAIFFYSSFPLPSKAASKLLAKHQVKILNDFYSWAILLGYVVALFVVCWLYTGFAMLLVLFFAAIVFLFYLGSISPVDDSALDLVFASSIEERAKKFSELDDETRLRLLAGVLVACGVISASSGHLRYVFLANSSAVSVELASGDTASLIQFASSSKGVFFNVHSWKQKFIPYSEITAIIASP